MQGSRVSCLGRRIDSLLALLLIFKKKEKYFLRPRWCSLLFDDLTKVVILCSVAQAFCQSKHVSVDLAF